MNDFDDETHSATIASDCDGLVRRGLLADEHASRGATFVHRPKEESEPTEMYRAVAVRVENETTTLLVGTKCDVSTSEAYRIVGVRGVDSGRLKTIRFRPTSE